MLHPEERTKGDRPQLYHPLVFRFRIQGLGLRGASGLGSWSRVQGAGFKPKGLKFRVQGSGPRVQAL